MGAPIGLGNFQESLEPIAKKSFHLGLGREVKDRKELYFDEVRTNKKTETYVELGDIGPVPDWDGELDYDDVTQGYTNTITNKVLGKGMRIEYEFVRTDQLRIAKSLPKMLGLAMRRRMAGDSATWFNDATASSYLTRDGLSLVNAAHTSNVGGSNQSNRITTPFSPVALSAARITMRKFTTNRDNIMEALPQLLYGGIDLEDSFDEVIKSKGQAYTADNTINVQQGKWTAVTDIRFSDTNNWCIADKMLQKEFNIWQTVDPVEFKQADIFDNRTAKYAVWAFYGFGSIGWEWILYSEVD